MHDAAGNLLNAALFEEHNPQAPLPGLGQQGLERSADPGLKFHPLEELAPEPAPGAIAVHVRPQEESEIGPWHQRVGSPAPAPSQPLGNRVGLPREGVSVQHHVYARLKLGLYQRLELVAVGREEQVDWFGGQVQTPFQVLV